MKHLPAGVALLIMATRPLCQGTAAENPSETLIIKKMPTNRLANEKSPYLLQHQHNPVDWYPWGAEAFEKARKERKPILLSIGYSTCHWCHVMERESFENEAIAAMMNQHFVSIKVDREERPDVDRVYMAFVQATTGSGGWPMNVFLTPDLKPFFGGTYFPPSDRWGRPGFPTLLHRIAEMWETDRAKLLAHGEETMASLREYTEPSAPSGTPNAATLQNAYAKIASGFDPDLGGFSISPKFPRPVTLNFLLRFYASENTRDPKSKPASHALEMAQLTLQKMADGGMHDQLGGGFHRYSVDRFWHIPHFEKMLYDQGQLACAYLDAFQITRQQRYSEVARDVLDYVRRDMTSPGGGFFSAEDADSPLPENPREHGEGAFYVWTQKEIDAALEPEAAKIFCQRYGANPDGNAPEGSDPQNEFSGKNTLIRRHSISEIAKLASKTEDEIERSLDGSSKTLLEIRGKRPKPHLDDKIITAWNGLMISAFARGAQVLGDAAYLESAERAAAFLRSHLYKEGRLVRSYREGASNAAGFADDYAFLIQGLLDLYEAGGRIEWLQWAVELQKMQDALFYDAEHGGYYSTTGDDPAILLRTKEDYDGAEPSPNSVAALNALRLGQALDDTALTERGNKTIRAFSAQLEKQPGAMPQMLVALDFSLCKPKQIVVAGAFADALPLLRELQAHFIPGKIILFADGGAGQHWLGERLEFIKTVGAADGKPAAYVCENFACKAPATTPEALKNALKP